MDIVCGACDESVLNDNLPCGESTTLEEWGSAGFVCTCDDKICPQ